MPAVSPYQGLRATTFYGKVCAEGGDHGDLGKIPFGVGAVVRGD